jgi:hypothetical protein
MPAGSKLIVAADAAGLICEQSMKKPYPRVAQRLPPREDFTASLKRETLLLAQDDTEFN